MSDSKSGQHPGASPASAAKDRLAVVEKLRNAFATHEFVLYAQSMLRLQATGETRPHFEIFVRLKEEERQHIPPGSFLPLLEEFDLGPQLDRYVVRTLLRSYQRKDPGKWGVAHLNLCRSTFSDKKFCAFVDGDLRKSSVPGELLCFEFPSADADLPVSAQAMAENFKKIGCRISVGAVEDETISFAPVKRLCADFLKFGGELIRNLENEDAAEDLRAAARACRASSVQTIAQHVETAPTLTLLRKLEIDFAQGYGISRPAPLDGAA